MIGWWVQMTVGMNDRVGTNDRLGGMNDRLGWGYK